uniref:Uncharacterized protein n=1 Tax=Opuntia streptacantha TaxID=393608 RepID=A0A7C9DW70_OPUST
MPICYLDAGIYNCEALFFPFLKASHPPPCDFLIRSVWALFCVSCYANTSSLSLEFGIQEEVTGIWFLNSNLSACLLFVMHCRCPKFPSSVPSSDHRLVGD